MLKTDTEKKERMPKITMEFNLPEEEEQAGLVFHAEDLYFVLYDLDRHLRSQLKYQKIPEEQVQAYTDIRKKLHEYMDAHDVHLEMLS